jgi:hypothetical protein
LFKQPRPPLQATGSGVSLNVVPANAGTHTPRPRVFGTVGDGFRSNRHLWLWVPAFAGTTHGICSRIHFSNSHDRRCKQPASRRHCEERLVRRSSKSEGGLRRRSVGRVGAHRDRATRGPMGVTRHLRHDRSSNQLQINKSWPSFSGVAGYGFASNPPYEACLMVGTPSARAFARPGWLCPPYHRTRIRDLAASFARGLPEASTF